MYHRNIRLLSIFNFLIGFTFFAPLAIIYFAKVSGSYTLGTSIFGIMMLSAAIFEVPTGILSDKVGRRYTIILGSWARVIAFIFYAIGISYWFLVGGAILEGLSRAFYSGNNEALLYDTLADDGKEKEYKEQLGKTSATEFTGLTLSAVIGGLVAQISFVYVMWLAVFSQIILLMVSFLFIEPCSRHKEDTNTHAHLREAIALFLTNKKLRLLSLATMLDNSLSELAYQFRGAFFITLWPVWALGFASVVSNMCASMGLYFSGKILNKMKAEIAVLLRSASDKVINIISLVFPTILSPVIMSSTSFLYGVGLVAESELRQKEFANHQRATMGSLISFGRSIGVMFMSLVLGKTADVFGPRLALLMMTILAFSVTYIYGIIYKNKA
ncbi:MFS transporter [Candidatus Roizmanbacteria bacterium]|nr:MFS transporter [Candidatus Roizmanbacteria bacterium]